ncbi:BI1-like protein [Primulina huaijiensis]|uniref:BI1-like protein n=1 Tax=Primulina huaijiensis TaxID=1492673 RepID=UPI003CC74981
MYGYTGVSSSGGGDGMKVGDIDLESGEMLYPGIGYGENQLRWGFIRKVYGILAVQIVLTTAVSAITVLYAPINDLLRGNSVLLLFLLFTPFLCKHVTDTLNLRFCFHISILKDSIALYYCWGFGKCIYCSCYKKEAWICIYSAMGAIIFSGYIVYDTDNLIKRYTYDEYIWASVTLYLDVLNLFLTILRMLRQGDN